MVTRLAGATLHDLGTRMKREPFYTDMGESLVLRDTEGGAMELPRYAVWKWDAARGRHQVAEVGEDLQALRAKHGEGPLVDVQRRERGS